MNEVAILEVEIGGEWVEWARVERESLQRFSGDCLVAMRPRTRVRFEQEPWEEAKE